MGHATIIGLGSYLPKKRMTNDDMARLVETSDEWIVSRTGIRERRITTGETTSELAYEAGNRAITDAGLKPEEVDLIICATISPDFFMPSVACIVQDKLGAVNAAAFDLAAACSGFVYGISVATAFIENGMYRNILVIGAETLSRALNWSDRSTCVLFGDGAGAAVLQASNKKGILAVNLLSDGSKQDYLCLPGLPLSNPFYPVQEASSPVITMKGQEVFKFAVRSIAENIKTLLLKTSLQKEEIRYIVAHQANCRILEQASKTCGIEIEKFFMNLDQYGNTSAATIGIALDEMKQKGMLSNGDKIIMVGFGGGMTSGAVMIEWNK